jgi:DNA-binding IclR family transcriptional regulator
MAPERRNLAKRSEVFERIVHRVVENPHARVTRGDFPAQLKVPPAAAERILNTLIEAGVLAETEKGVWVRTWPEAIDIDTH